MTSYTEWLRHAEDKERREGGDPFRLEWERDHDELLELRDRRDEMARVAFYGGIHLEQPSERERHLWREARDERQAQNQLRPRTGNVEVQPRSVPVCTCNARETGFPHDGHRYSCPRHTRHPASIRDAA